MRCTRPAALVAAAIVAAMLMPGSLMAGDGIGAAARSIRGKHHAAVITATIISDQRMVMSGREMNKGERKDEVNALIIDSSGLAVISLYQVDPWAGFAPGFGEEGDAKMSWESEIAEVRMLMADGSEIPARVVLRDKDLDMAFIRPIAVVSRPFPYLNISRSVRLNLMDEVIILSRLGRAAGRSASLSACRIQAVINKPRLSYIPDPVALYSGLARPVFSIQGKFAGVLLMRIMPSRAGSIDEVAVVLPGEQVLEIARQAIGESGM